MNNHQLPSKSGDFLLVLQSAAVGTIYPDPTGEGTPLALTYRGSSVAGNSPFATAGRSAVIKAIHFKRSSAAGSLMQVQTHSGATLIDAVGAGVGGGAADQDIIFGDDGVNIPNGFRLVTTGGTVSATIVYAVEKSVAP